MSEREALIAAGVIRPRVDGPTPEIARDAPCLRMDRSGRIEAERAVTSGRRHARPLDVEHDRKGRP